MEPIVLTGRWVQLEPLAEGHREGLCAAADDDRIWEHFLTDGRGSGFDPWFDEAFRQRDAGRAVPFAVRLLAGGRPVGCTAYLDYSPRHRRVEIGGTWYHPDVWGTRVNPECKLLLLAYAFDILGVNRVQLVTDVRNDRSQRAIAKLGAIREGVLRAHMVSRNGRVRDSVLFAITTADWPAVRAGLEERLTSVEA
ncbi:MAG TPA: GNAT family protein [Gemmataceae bacterium]|nr:GNAT family protein [Gemmataceae bacterium]